MPMRRWHPGAVTLPEVSAADAGGARLELVPGRCDLSTLRAAVLVPTCGWPRKALREQLLRLKEKPIRHSPNPYVVLDARFG